MAAVGDVHLDQDVLGRYRPALEHLGQKADLLLLAGDLTRHGTAGEAQCVAQEFGGLPVPVVAVLGNHDYHCDQVPEVTAVLRDAGHHRARVQRHRAAPALDCGSASPVRRASAAGSPAACGSEFGEPEMKAFTRHTRDLAEGFGDGAAGPRLRRTARR